MLSSVWGPEPHSATWRIYDWLELHTLDFSLNRSISRCAQALNKSPWGEHIKNERHASLWGVCLTPTSIKGIRLHSCMHTNTEDIMPVNQTWCTNPPVQLQCAWLDGGVHSEANLKTTGLCTDHWYHWSISGNTSCTLSRCKRGQHQLDQQENTASPFYRNTRHFGI